ncbi:hypothetical protein J437_LFUL005043 [Ladona fulva]|uniref:Uncharacterized protein n=1 Tax=Ladona fulva TaxID=123851 RepID=A0A8K0P9I2_LADFU|nr:hypothetical protein J437_LFUL005043 [Ladona fulva]
MSDDHSSSAEGFMYKVLVERDPKKRKVKPVPQQSLLDLDLGESSDDSDFRIEDHDDESDDDSIDSEEEDGGKTGKMDEDDGEDDEDEEEEEEEKISGMKLKLSQNEVNVSTNEPETQKNPVVKREVSYSFSLVSHSSLSFTLDAPKFISKDVN